MEFQVESMSCGHCVGVSRDAVRSVDATAIVQVDLERHAVHVESSRPREALAAAIGAAGYATH